MILMKRNTILVGTVAFLMVGFVVACEAPVDRIAFSPEASPERVGVQQGEGGESLPDYAYRSAAALKGYQIAVRENELLVRLPCYCGCGQDEQYRNLRDCFLDDKGEFRSHGANCQICLDETEDAAQWKGQGLPIKEIRARIDQKYEDRGKPTDTPPVAE
jgi:hypothetical protein